MWPPLLADLAPAHPKVLRAQQWAQPHPWQTQGTRHPCPAAAGLSQASVHGGAQDRVPAPAAGASDVLPRASFPGCCRCRLRAARGRTASAAPSWPGAPRRSVHTLEKGEGGKPGSVRPPLVQPRGSWREGGAGTRGDTHPPHQCHCTHSSLSSSTKHGTSSRLKKVTPMMLEMVSLRASRHRRNLRAGRG